MAECHTQFSEKVNVLAEIIRDRVLDPIFIDRNLTGETYLTLLKDELVPALEFSTAMIKDNL